MDQVTNISIKNDISAIEEPCMGSLAIRRLSKKINSPKEIWLKRHSDTMAAKADNHRLNIGVKCSTAVNDESMLNSSNTVIYEPIFDIEDSNFVFTNESNEVLTTEDSPLDFSNTTSKLSSLTIEKSQNEEPIRQLRSLSTNNAFNYILAIQPLTHFDSVPNLFTFSPISTSSPIRFDASSTPSFMISPPAYLNSSPLMSPTAVSLASSPNSENRRHLYARRRSPGLIRPICLVNTESQTQIALPTTPVSLNLPSSPRTILSPIPELRIGHNESDSTIGQHQLPQHKCSYCQRCFSRSDMLSRHLRLHTGHRPYDCPYCPQVFSRSDHLQTHLRTHTGEKPYRCAECGYAAPRRDMVTRHMRVHENRGESGCRVKKTKSSESLLHVHQDVSDEDEQLRQHMRQQIKIMYEQKQLTKKQMLDSQIQDFIFNELKKLKEATGLVTGQLIKFHLSDATNTVHSIEATTIDAHSTSSIDIKNEIKDHGFEDSEVHISCTSPNRIQVISHENNNLSRTISEGSMDSGVSYLTPCTPASTLWSPCSPEVFTTITDVLVSSGSRFQWPADAKS